MWAVSPPEHADSIDAAIAARGAELVQLAIEQLRVCLAELTTPVVLPGMQNFLYEWKWADLQVKLNAVNLPKGLTISEDVEVPMPVRPDAPARKK